MIETHGLSHVALSVLPDRSLAFYQSVFGVREYFRSDSTIQVLGPGQYDVLAFEKRPADAGATGGIIHFGFRLTRPEDIDAAVAAVESAGGVVLSRRVRSRPAVCLRS
jgi:catechol 2,3-dioxygenase-like lactoylglutathione lyase family enzyme